MYAKTIHKIEQECQERGIILVKVSPSYTSQNCSKCGCIDSNNRKGELYQCKCGCEMDADHNASINIHNRGIYDSSNH